MERRALYIPVCIDDLIQYANHPFKPYEGKRLSDMVESIKANGVMTPIIVRAVANDKYEILSGHNRVKAAGLVGLEAVPAIVYDSLTDEEALFIVTETNLLQRSFADMLHSERAVAIAAHYEAIKKKSGYRSDLTENLIDQTLAPVEPRLSSKERLGNKHGLSASTIARYLRINKLVSELKERLDNGKIGMRVAEAISNLRVNEQLILEKLLTEGYKINIKQARQLHDESIKRELVYANIKLILTSADKDININKKINNNLVLDTIISKHFNEEYSSDEIGHVIDKALEMYLKNSIDIFKK